MRILAIGDVCGSIGCEYVRKVLPTLKREKQIDMVIINGENSADGNGVTPYSADYLFGVGAHVLTGGNHSLRRSEVYDYLDSNDLCLRPHNLPEAQNGKGYCVVDFGRTQVAVINLSGKIYLEKLGAGCPFAAADELIEKAKNDGVKIIVVDFHAEASSEKLAMGRFLDGRVTAVLGTHTHVQTADAKVLPGGTAVISDTGMCGAEYSILGREVPAVLRKFRTGMATRLPVVENGDIRVDGVCVSFDQNTGRATGITAFSPLVQI